MKVYKVEWTYQCELQESLNEFCVDGWELQTILPTYSTWDGNCIPTSELDAFNIVLVREE